MRSEAEEKSIRRSHSNPSNHCHLLSYPRPNRTINATEVWLKASPFLYEFYFPVCTLNPRSSPFLYSRTELQDPFKSVSIYKPERQLTDVILKMYMVIIVVMLYTGLGDNKGEIHMKFLSTGKLSGDK